MPLCRHAHRDAPWSLHRDGIESFQRRFGDLSALAAALLVAYEAEFPERAAVGPPVIISLREMHAEFVKAVDANNPRGATEEKLRRWADTISLAIRVIEKECP